jgi:hypothetical protein
VKDDAVPDLVNVVTVIHGTNCANMNVEPLAVDLGEQSPDNPGNATRR